MIQKANLYPSGDIVFIVTEHVQYILPNEEAGYNKVFLGNGNIMLKVYQDGEWEKIEDGEV